MVKTCKKWPLDTFLKKNWETFAGIQRKGRVELWVDCEVEDEILTFLEESRAQKKFRRILFHILEGSYSEDFYEKETVSSKAKDVTAMKFKGGGLNARIYCKEVSTRDIRKIVLSRFVLKKKTQKVTGRLKNLIESIGSYEYAFKEEQD